MTRRRRRNPEGAIPVDTHRPRVGDRYAFEFPGMYPFDPRVCCRRSPRHDGEVQGARVRTPTIHMNGSNPETLLEGLTEAYRAVDAAMRALDESLTAWLERTGRSSIGGRLLLRRR